MSYGAPVQGIVAQSDPLILPVPNAFNGNAFPVPYPTGVPQIFNWVVVTNSSAYTLLVSQAQLLGVVSAFTAQLFPVTTGGPLSVLPIPGVATPLPGVDLSVYVTWYQAEPDGAYPSALGAGTVPIATNALIVAQDFGSAGFAQVGPGVGQPVPGWVQGCALIVNASGGTGVLVLVQGTSGNDILQCAVSDGQIVMFPTAGDPGFTVTLVGQGGAGIGLVSLYGLVSAPPDSSILPWGYASGFVFTGAQFTASANIAAGGSSPLIPAPPMGFQVRLKGWSWSFITQPAAGAAFGLQATTHVVNMARVITAPLGAGIVASTMALDWWIPDQNVGGVNIPDGLTGFNSTAQIVQMSVPYEIWPTRLSPV